MRNDIDVTGKEEGLLRLRWSLRLHFGVVVVVSGNTGFLSILEVVELNEIRNMWMRKGLLYPLSNV